MGLKKAENQVKILLAETILSMCRNTLNYHAEICVEGLLGITLDNEEIFLVNINQTIKNQIDTPGKAASSKENLKRSRKEDVGSDTEPESSSNESESSSTKKRRKRVRRKKHKGEKGSGSENGELADVSANADQTLQSDETDRKFSQVNLEQTDGSEQYYENSNQTAGDDSYTEEGAPSSVNVTVKQEPPGGPESDDDLVFVKQEVDEFSMSQPSAHQFSNLSQVFQSSADMSLSQPSDMMSGAFFASPANNMSANAMQQPVPGPSGANTGKSRRSAELCIEEKFVDGMGRVMYMCKECGKIITTRTGLLQHRRTHSGERPFVCKICGKRSARKGHVKDHFLRKHSEVQWDPCYIITELNN